MDCPRRASQILGEDGLGWHGMAHTGTHHGGRLLQFSTPAGLWWLEAPEGGGGGRVPQHMYLKMIATLR